MKKLMTDETFVATILLNHGNFRHTLPLLHDTVVGESGGDVGGVGGGRSAL